MGIVITGIGITSSFKKDKFNLLDSINFLSQVIKKSLERSQLKIKKRDASRIGLCVGTTLNNIDERIKFNDDFLRGGLISVNPIEFPATLISYPATQAAIKFNIKGFCTTVSSGVSSGFDAIDYAIYFLKRNKDNIALATEVELPMPKSRHPEVTLRRDTAFGMASCLVLENEISAFNRGCPVYGKIAAISSFFEKEGQSCGLKKAISHSLEKSNLKEKDISSVFAIKESLLHKKGQEQAIKEIFAKFRPPIFEINFRRILESRAKSIMLVNLGVNSNSSCLIIYPANHAYGGSRRRREGGVQR
ncbi:MAG: hypothetical protein ISS47_08305 [Candidatus Omnitrophica bacterium]|nr:hypothetical protein [Candidatus Omnitrophota bacterium]